MRLQGASKVAIGVVLYQWQLATMPDMQLQQLSAKT